MPFDSDLADQRFLNGVRTDDSWLALIRGFKEAKRLEALRKFLLNGAVDLRIEVGGLLTEFGRVSCVGVGIEGLVEITDETAY